MLKPSKILLFALMFLMSTLGGITLSMIDWEVLEKGKGIDIYIEK